ncbi:MAG: PQQ-dependent sugar dehydrogenase, partial [Aquihabitans sp.]
MLLRTRLAKSVFGVGAAALAMVGLTSCPGPATLTVTNVITDLDHPWDLSFRPDGTLFFTERAGRINLRTSAGVVRTLASPSDVVAVGEGGMLGIATDPAFESNRRIYTCMLSKVSGSLDVRLVRWVVDARLTTLSSRADIVTGLPANSTGRHLGCRPRFGPDGYLWVGTGDS